MICNKPAYSHRHNSDSLRGGALSVPTTAGFYAPYVSSTCLLPETKIWNMICRIWPK